jgi:hypothetical protein
MTRGKNRRRVAARAARQEGIMTAPKTVQPAGGQQQARARADKIKIELGTLADRVRGLHELIAEAYEQRDWEHLGYATWETYCREEFSVNLLKLDGRRARASAAG